MKIDEKVLHSFDAEIIDYRAKEFIFHDGDLPLYYFQIQKGTVKLNHYDENGKEFIHNILSDEQSFGDSLLFLKKAYPMNAITLTPCTIIKLPKKSFFRLLNENPELNRELNSCFSQQLYFNLLMMQSLSSTNPTARILGLMDYLKSFDQAEDLYSFHVQLTRQQIADLTGLRVETVIRTLKKMSENNSIKVENKRIFY
ncbi:Crp/Fnr family transcriptional regulator [Chryseobacterium sp. MYb264]|uniref:Crp/Fnr family transcriptional regulator n=1 Tax=Chryseobacterium sp. MYb264 TaxID=2745153 RepID=UPI002E1569B8|nr:Crp/Fnr family transcriptional regulator [Chryseobacterium sp. MYb264]